MTQEGYQYECKIYRGIWWPPKGHQIGKEFHALYFKLYGKFPARGMEFN